MIKTLTAIALTALLAGCTTLGGDATADRYITAVSLNPDGSLKYERINLDAGRSRAPDAARSLCDLKCIGWQH